MAATAKEPAQSEKSLEEQLQFQKRLNTITNKIHSAKDTDDILVNLQDEILALFDADRITVYVVDGASRQVVSRFKTGSEASEIRVPINNDSITGYCASFGKVDVVLGHSGGQGSTEYPLGFNPKMNTKNKRLALAKFIFDTCSLSF